MFNHKIKKNRGLPAQAGMTYVEVIVVLSIFSIVSSVSIYSYGDFQAKVDIKNLASDVGQKIVEAQKSALSGLLPPLSKQALIPSLPLWKPSYGVYFNLTDNKSFLYFVDADMGTLFDGTDCTGECVSKTSVTKGNYISRLDVFYQSAPTVPVSVPNLTFSFTRPNSGASITGSPALGSNISYAQVTVASPKGATAAVKIYPSGRIEIK